MKDEINKKQYDIISIERFGDESLVDKINELTSKGFKIIQYASEQNYKGADDIWYYNILVKLPNI